MLPSDLVLQEECQLPPRHGKSSQAHLPARQHLTTIASLLKPKSPNTQFKFLLSGNATGMCVLLRWDHPNAMTRPAERAPAIARRPLFVKQTHNCQGLQHEVSTKNFLVMCKGLLSKDLVTAKGAYSQSLNSSLLLQHCSRPILQSGGLACVIAGTTTQPSSIDIVCSQTRSDDSADACWPVKFQTGDTAFRHVILALLQCMVSWSSYKLEDANDNISCGSCVKKPISLPQLQTACMKTPSEICKHIPYTCNRLQHSGSVKGRASWNAQGARAYIGMVAVHKAVNKGREALL